VVAAMSWEGADESILSLVRNIADIDQLLVRALIFRIVTDRTFAITRGEAARDAVEYVRVVDLVLERLRGG
jgi:hypothetical protein